MLIIGLLANAGLLEAQVTPLAARNLPRGTVLVSGDVVVPDAEVEEATDVIGWITRRVVAEGEPLEPPAISPQDVIRSGDAVQLIYRAGSLEVRMRGKAMGSAAVGERVLVRVDTQRRYEGIAQKAGEVRLASPETK